MERISYAVFLKNMNYNFDILDWQEFELFSRDLIQRELNVILQSFKPGKDKGIDCRYSGSENNEIVVQAKRYSDYRRLLNVLSDEKKKIEALYPIPKRYILSISLDLSPIQLEEIGKILSPHLISLDDIYYASKLNNILSRPNNSDIEKKYYRLWLTSTNILTRILHNSTSSSSDFNTEKIKRMSGLYVYNNMHLTKAVEILNKERFLIITGSPGIGKTTLAYIITFNLLAEDYKLIYAETVNQATELLNSNPDDKQIVLFDDFLGSFIHEIYNSSNEKKLVNFLERIKNYKNKLMILTSRTIFYNEALQVYERFHKNYIDLSKYELTISHYTKLEKARILYKHLNFSDMDLAYKNELIVDKRYFQIINHRNYTPRLIEFFTNPKSFQSIKIEDYFKGFVLKNLEHPHEIWKFHYETQIDDDSRMIIDSLFLLGDGCSYTELEKSYNQRVKFEKKIRDFPQKINSFSKAIKILQESFIYSKREYSSPDKINFSLLNPSIGDFLISYYNDPTNADLKKGLICSVISIDEFVNRFHSKKQGFVNINEEDFILAMKYLIENISILKQYTRENCSIEYELIDISRLNFDIEILDAEQLSHLLDNLDVTEIPENKLYSFLYFLTGNYKSDIIKKFVNSNWDKIIIKALNSFNDSYEFYQIKNLFSMYDKDYDEYFYDYPDLLKDSLDSYITKRLKEYLTDTDIIQEIGGREYLIDKLENIVNEKIVELAEECDYKDFARCSDYLYEDEVSSNIDSFIENWKSENSSITEIKNDFRVENNETDEIDELFSESF